ncbi:fumarylacetoacetate hydrolase family protein [Corynebacterium macginleyi]|mgnify:FL=1|uniref:fumarylacetoacetate hydrolase family protein n=1 Tax=Corynebacterium macginleyi TaxID=38290 RepID=UPI001909BEB2|nr:fumarylacetoacetate hydrolase family protein [Corynebacterium macginleyi]MBM0261716.1 fumarylacetoacetate hydrolase family protein [Corynebacterium macginleyi]QRJ57024.1 fumarylacetoacetate hydrolase family protein [Corynebacterium macginleyi]
MRLGRIAHPEGICFAIIDGPQDSPIEELVAKEIAGTPFTPPEPTGREWKLGEVRLLAPTLPTKVVALGRNYADHVEEVFKKSSEQLPPTIFLKPSTAVIGPNEAIKIPDYATNVEFEGELAVVISRPSKNIKSENWKNHVLGYTICNDVSSRDLQFKDGQWARAKGIDTFCPLGPWIETDLDSLNLDDQKINAYLTHDGFREQKQDSNTDQMIVKMGDILEEISAAYTLLPGDVITTGSPAGTAPMVPGDTIEIEIPGVGTLRNSIARAR